MPRTVITGNSPNALLPAGISGPGVLAMVFSAADNSAGNAFLATGNDLLLVWNSDSVGQTITIASAPDQYGRKADITNYSLAAGAFANVLVTSASLFKQTDGNVYVNASANTIKFFLLNL